MTTALILAGGTGTRMNSRVKPKQFIEIHGKPILIYTLEHFEYHEEIDDIVIVCLEDWIEKLKIYLHRFGITKVYEIVPGGPTGHDSIYNGLVTLKKKANPDDIILIHDGVRPLITGELITENIRTVRKSGNAVTVEVIRESVIKSTDGKFVSDVPALNQMFVAKAPQSFYFKDISEVFEQAEKDGFKAIDSAHLMNHYGKTLHMVKSTKNNIKITEPADYYMFRALCQAAENQQIFGI
ncbi:2-C-methyl-D-erythritol 4-phosphate cytidylyltransferase [Herbinix hemicellulosilytica]|uniref:2-C-methyl-D-erythritol 4-phosphate cytidylyltransferase n=1 Tax=Herbinix hemicellulosilytica TaxID=1564487 RepID=A0A0H5SXV4_HERHM|nr:IspD/TarI family cytidylyltransferase [Herbinix hemicellulosilytica]RBP59805.1 2-C-methyl-D-erythritol 4-phosphate cytidylyltransferase [Herbinix hemicellulosilytica]CRZ35193.1 2-C-methyl-D-erythritol 4-phosphate cytidylyltransferase [Herbinix hemicellulosilytica]